MDASPFPSRTPVAPATVAVHAGRPVAVPDAPLNVPVTLASTYVAGGALEYGRYGNPTWTAFEETVGALEGGRAVAYASGMAAVSAVLALVPRGGRVIAPRDAYSGTLDLLRTLADAGRIGALELVDIADLDAVRRAAAQPDEPGRLRDEPGRRRDEPGRRDEPSRRDEPGLPGPSVTIWVESPTNPALRIADLQGIGELDALVVVDNTFATPLLQRPFETGADLVVHSATKYLAGHSDVALGVVVVPERGPGSADDERLEALRAYRKGHGATPGPFETWLALRGLRTLHLRTERACANALELATRLAEHPAVRAVRYPGLPSDPGHAIASRQMSAYGAIVCFEPRGGVEVADALAGRTSLWVHATSLGGVESTFERRRRWPSESPSVPDSLVRLSVGIEDIDDLWADLSGALT